MRCWCICVVRPCPCGVVLVRRGRSLRILLSWSGGRIFLVRTCWNWNEADVRGDTARRWRQMQIKLDVGLVE
jgi:hypothetical protein